MGNYFSRGENIERISSIPGRSVFEKIIAEHNYIITRSNCGISYCICTRCGKCGSSNHGIGFTSVKRSINNLLINHPNRIECESDCENDPKTKIFKVRRDRLEETINICCKIITLEKNRRSQMS
jgi:hypothetical protein